MSSVPEKWKSLTSYLATVPLKEETQPSSDRKRRKRPTPKNTDQGTDTVQYVMGILQTQRAIDR
jgi:hypothetical protein